MPQIDNTLTFSMAECCRRCGKPQIYVRNLQKALGLPVAGAGALYSAAYVAFIMAVVALRTFCVPLDEIADLLEREKSLLRLLKMDALLDSTTWFLDQCGSRSNGDRRLFLSGYDVGFPLGSGAIQANLDFGNREQELFDGHEMGEDVRRALNDYLKAVAVIKQRIRRETDVLKNALQWARAADA